MKSAATAILASAALILSLACIVFAAGIQQDNVVDNAERSKANVIAIRELGVRTTDTAARLEMMEKHYALMHSEQTAALKELSQRIDAVILRERDR